jgi:hypothetical protein
MKYVGNRHPLGSTLLYPPDIYQTDARSICPIRKYIRGLSANSQYTGSAAQRTRAVFNPQRQSKQEERGGWHPGGKAKKRPRRRTVRHRANFELQVRVGSDPGLSQSGGCLLRLVEAFSTGAGGFRRRLECGWNNGQEGNISISGRQLVREP